MEIGISTATFWTKAYVEDSLPLINELNVGVCEVFLNTFSEYEPEFAKMLAGRKGKLAVHSVHSLNTHFEPQLFNISERTRLDAEVFFKKVVDAGEILGAKAYTFHGSSKNKFKTAYKYDFKWLGAVMENLSSYSKRKGVDVAFENVYWAMFDKPEFFLNLKEESPSVKACLDLKQAALAEVDYKKYLDAMADRLVTVHISDFDQNGKTVLPGRGTVDFYRLFSDIKERGLDVPLIMELYPTDFETMDELKSAVYM
ncbi:MAG TPA: sugar phosphate isomerase/epimerase, partial [Clostridia bacterium]|nr:sugar phosphate isomerase/epimerase [Clostridia bacterium]